MILNNKVIAMESKLCEKELIINNLVAKAETSLPAESNLSENNGKHLLKKKNILDCKKWRKLMLKKMRKLKC